MPVEYGGSVATKSGLPLMQAYLLIVDLPYKHKVRTTTTKEVTEPFLHIFLQTNAFFSNYGITVRYKKAA